MDGIDLRERLLGVSVIIYFYLLAMFPMQTIIVSVIIALMYFIVINIRNNSGIHHDRFDSTRRKNALSNAKLYLSPYKNIWKDLKLSNKYCYLILGKDGVSITGVEKMKCLNEQYRVFSVVVSRVHPNRELWDMFCLHFDHLTNYETLLELCHRFNVTIKESVHGNVSAKKNNKIQKIQENVEKTDVNNASEIALTALPGISIVMSKKIIKKREEIGGFKNVDEFFVYIKIKPHMENQLRNLVCVKKMKGSLKIERYNERNIDL